MAVGNVAKKMIIYEMEKCGHNRYLRLHCAVKLF